MHLKSEIACFCLLFIVWTVDAQAQAPNCPNLQAAVDSVAFPEEAIQLGIGEGNAVVAFTVRADGEVVDKQVKSATHPVFGDAALSVVSRLRCDRRSTSLQTQLPVNFKFGDPLSLALFEQTGCKGAAQQLLGFPREAIQLGLTRGETVIEFRVDADGRPTEVVILASTHEVFSKVARGFVERLNCKPTVNRMRIPFGFRLE
ncbi:TonB family protein [Rhizobacter sp. SG703]|uniref:TonB family protein n=1 Tax=Rhizobacter sp. SG703 TaxID=2587140 RepID=UPI0014482586|nr:TonB family protein [Rhizobacter sp. SG703]NKI97122.1 TonB family protein [Rhizobacter sp. SG703]